MERLNILGQLKLVDKCLDFMDSQPDSGGLGVKMIDGKGKFLPESKRGLPTPSAAFYKIFGLSSLFPKSKLMGKYHLGYLSKEENHSIEVLSGAFMLLRKKALDKIGLLDEAFFMYGEDTDLCYRSYELGHPVLYTPDSQAFHYHNKVPLDRARRKRLLREGLTLFARKHYGPLRARVYRRILGWLW